MNALVYLTPNTGEPFTTSEGTDLKSDPLALRLAKEGA